jgi:hypothetical protein
MYKIKLSILLLISFLLISCTNSNLQSDQKTQYAIDYITGGYDGLVLKKLLQANLKGFLIFNPESDIIIQPSIGHQTEVFITNIDNTSDRERVSTNLQVNIFDKKNDCFIATFDEDASQFFIYASNEKFLSNESALESIKYDNTEELVKTFINSLKKIERVCK